MLSLTTSGDRPEPVLDAARLASAVSGVVLAVGAVLVLVGWATTDQVRSWSVIAGGAVTAIGTLLAIVLPSITALGARAQVTPLAAPVGVDGVPLITSTATVPAPAPSSLPPGDDTGELPPTTTPAPSPAPAVVTMSAAEHDAEYQKWIDSLSTDEPTGPVPAEPVDRTPQPIELEAQAAATSPSISAPTGSSEPVTGPIAVTTVPPVPAASTGSTSTIAVQTA
jgi:hypothetical protein